MMQYRALTTLALAGLMAAGCAPENPFGTVDPETPVEARGLRFAGLLRDAQGLMDVAIIDEQGGLEEYINLDLSNADSLTWHPNDYLLVTTGAGVMRVDWDGSATLLHPRQSYQYRVTTGPDDDVVVTEEYEAEQVSEDGDVVLAAEHDSSVCWMDAAPGVEEGDDPVMLNVYGPDIRAWSSETNSFRVIASNVGNGNILGRDDDATYYVGGWDGQVDISQPGSSRPITVRIPQGGQIMALESAGPDAVVALVGNNGYWDEAASGGSSLYLIRDVGQAQPLGQLTGQWTDLTRIP